MSKSRTIVLAGAVVVAGATVLAGCSSTAELPRQVVLESGGAVTLAEVLDEELDVVPSDRPDWRPFADDWRSYRVLGSPIGLLEGAERIDAVTDGEGRVRRIHASYPSAMAGAFFEGLEQMWGDQSRPVEPSPDDPIGRSGVFFADNEDWTEAQQSAGWWDGSTRITVLYDIRFAQSGTTTAGSDVTVSVIVADECLNRWICRWGLR